jgi:hypothetical protein
MDIRPMLKPCAANRNVGYSTNSTGRRNTSIVDG